MKREEIITEFLNYFKQEFDFKLEDNIDLLECEKNMLTFLIDKLKYSYNKFLIRRQQYFLFTT